MLFIGENLLFLALFVVGLMWLIGVVIFVTFIVTMAYARTYYDRSELKGGRAWPWLRRLRLWQWCRRCYRHKVVRYGEELPLGVLRRPVLYICSPHGVNATSFFFTFLVEPGPDEAWPVSGAVLNLLLGIPILREFLLAMGCVNVDRETLMRQLIKKKHSVALIPEGCGASPPPPHRQSHIRNPGDCSPASASGPVGVAAAHGLPQALPRGTRGH